VKLGGALWSAGGEGLLRGLGAVLERAAASRGVLVVPGGGPFADAVRRAAAQASLSDTAAHRMAILAMEQYGLLLADVLGAATTACTGRADGVAVLLPGALAESPELPASWSVTSDSIAALVAARAGAGHVVLVKSVNGLDDGDGGTAPRILDAAMLVARQEEGGARAVDGWLARAVLRFGVEAWLVDGREPEHLSDALSGGHTHAIRIVPRLRR
jgi:aspartokinase-like uncharacterized kinase